MAGVEGLEPPTPGFGDRPHHITSRHDQKRLLGDNPLFEIAFHWLVRLS
jgi:hypothetical protein